MSISCDVSGKIDRVQIRPMHGQIVCMSSAGMEQPSSPPLGMW